MKMNGLIWKMLGKGVLGRGLTALSALLLTLFLPAVLESESVGNIYLSLSIAALISIFSRWGVDNATNEKVAHCEGEEERRVKASVAAAALMGVSISSLIWLIAGKYFVNALGVDLSMMGVLGVSFLSAALAISYILFQLYRIDGYVLWGALTRGFFINAVLLVVLLLVLALKEKPSVDQILIFWGGGILICTIINFYDYSRKNKFLISDIRARVVVSLFSTRLFGYAVLLYFVTDADYYFIQGYMDPADLAVYASMKRLAVMAAIYTDVAHLMLPGIYKKYVQSNDLGAAVAVFRKLAVLGFSLSIFITAAAYFFMKDISLLFWPESYLSGVPALVIMLSGFALAMSFGFSEMWLLLKGDKSALLMSMLLALVTCLLLNFILTPNFGIVGAAIAFAMSNVMLRLGLSLYVLRKYRVRLMMWWR